MSHRIKKPIKYGKLQEAPKTYRKYLILALKVVITCLALYFVAKSIDPLQAWQTVRNSQPLYLVMATIFFSLSKWLSAYRLNLYFKDISLHLQNSINLRLYWLGMYYNLFLPGGIGGDAYKAIWLSKQYPVGLGKTAQAILLDRINGMVALTFLALLSSLWIPKVFTFSHYPWALVTALAIYPLHYLGIKWFFPIFLPGFLMTHLYSLGVQSLQLVCLLFLLAALAEDPFSAAYICIFLVSSVVSVLPLTIGGLGSRELVFLLGSQYLSLNPQTSVATGILFYLITAIVSLAGGYYLFKPVVQFNKTV